MRARVYHLKGFYKIVCFSQAKSGIWIATDPFVSINVDSDSEEIRKELFMVLNSSKNNIKDSMDFDNEFAVFNEKLGLKKGVHIEKLAKSFDVKFDGENLFFTPCIRKGRTRYYEMKKDLTLIINSKIETIDFKDIFKVILDKCE